MHTLSVRIRQLREHCGLSQEQLALETGTSQRQISKYETGKNEPTAHVLFALAARLNTSTDYLLGRTDNPDRLLRSDEDLDTDEREIIKLIRRQSPEQRQRIVNAVKALSN
jgi:transcriptional regulator with XRE-family HTH domain